MRRDTGIIALWCLCGLVVAFVAAAIGFSVARSARPATAAAAQGRVDALKPGSSPVTLTRKASQP